MCAKINCIKTIILKDQGPVTQNFEILSKGLPAKKADLILLILASQHIESRVEKEGTIFHILVDTGDKSKAFAAINAYYRENRHQKIRQTIQNFSMSPFKSIPAFMIMGFLAAIHLFCLYYDLHDAMILKYGASSLFIRQGENFRAITALFLHADERHLLGNLAGILIFGAPFINLSGFGTGPFMLLLTGTLGNLMTAGLYRTARISIGASTSVMGAAGLLVAFQMTRKGKTRSRDTVIPLIAGAILVGLLSQGERTDVFAHIFGFLNGFIPGLIFFPLNRTVQSGLKEPAALLITLLIVISSFLSGIFKDIF
ncbi:MAG: rhomboid family intramembrane serine protease [Desulfobacula sp.]|jgi:membrane associated rhomboid family serine protease